MSKLYFSAPGLSWDEMLKMTKIKFELISYPDMYIFFYKGTRCGISYIYNKYSKANNKYSKSYDPKQESKHIIYLDANNLYGYAMSKFLLTIRFKWIDLKEFDLNKYTSNSSKGCVLEVNLEFNLEYLEHQLKIADLYNIPIGNIKKLVSNFFDKEKYVLHYEKLKRYLRLRLKLKKNIAY